MFSKNILRQVETTIHTATVLQLCTLWVGILLPPARNDTVGDASDEESYVRNRILECAELTTCY